MPLSVAYRTHLSPSCSYSQQPRPCKVKPQTAHLPTVMAAMQWATLMTSRLCSSKFWRAALSSTRWMLPFIPWAPHRSSAFIRWETKEEQTPQTRWSWQTEHLTEVYKVMFWIIFYSTNQKSGLPIDLNERLCPNGWLVLWVIYKEKQLLEAAVLLKVTMYRIINTCSIIEMSKILRGDVIGLKLIRLEQQGEIHHHEIRIFIEILMNCNS